MSSQFLVARTALKKYDSSIQYLRFDIHVERVVCGPPVRSSHILRHFKFQEVEHEVGYWGLGLGLKRISDGGGGVIGRRASTHL